LPTVPDVGSPPVDDEGVEGVAMFIVGGGSVGARMLWGLSYIAINLLTFSKASSNILSSAAVRSPTVGNRRRVSIKLCHTCVFAVGQQTVSLCVLDIYPALHQRWKIYGGDGLVYAT
jgi:hypothetical protein